jgi:sigma-B regulation protein RsbU (phosphoserine phosphatase)
MRYVNAGHLRPLHLRGGRLIHELDGGRRMPFGLDDVTGTLGETFLQPHDRLLLYTDGITEARSSDGTVFGTARLVELTERLAGAGLPTPETLRRLCHTVIDHQGGPPVDDATLLLLDWSSAAAHRNVP